MNKAFILSGVAAVALCFASPAMAIDWHFLDYNKTTIETSPAVPGTPGTPGKHIGGSVLDEYIPPRVASNIADVPSNKCWTSPRKTNLTAGTQGTDGVCIANGTLASSSNSVFIPGTPATPGTPAEYADQYKNPILGKHTH